MTEITISLNGIKYLVVEELVTGRTESIIQKKCDKYGCIFQGIKEIQSGGFFGETYAILNILVPEEKIIAYNSDNN